MQMKSRAGGSVGRGAGTRMVMPTTLPYGWCQVSFSSRKGLGVTLRMRMLTWDQDDTHRLPVVFIEVHNVLIDSEMQFTIGRSPFRLGQKCLMDLMVRNFITGSRIVPFRYPQGIMIESTSPEMTSRDSPSSIPSSYIRRVCRITSSW